MTRLEDDDHGETPIRVGCRPGDHQEARGSAQGDSGRQRGVVTATERVEGDDDQVGRGQEPRVRREAEAGGRDQLQEERGGGYRGRGQEDKNLESEERQRLEDEINSKKNEVEDIVA